MPIRVIPVVARCEHEIGPGPSRGSNDGVIKDLAYAAAETHIGAVAGRCIVSDVINASDDTGGAA